ncbi:LD-carboxypeptidase [Megasphaera hexanoica]|uniref:LD-carboxypeptidase n=1 Tax=Megasphaera hexanoica TaxID=1675036 RepID=A0ABW7DNG8_9FIRM|nr:LD-carboxypeptidase [Megasphaera hexanoica]AXB81544.1 LD-carboxypeptidase [Megasphaera hexanoica]
MQQYTLGRALQPGDTLGIVAPSAPLDEKRFQAGLAYLHSLGLKTKCGQSVQERWGYLAGSDDVRARDINGFFADSSIDGILCMRGGYGAARLLPLLDYDAIARHPKLFIGFSDITALHTALLQRSGLATIHGAMLTGLGGKATRYTYEQFAAGLANPAMTGPVRLPRGHHLETLVEGDAEGILAGGNMMLISSLIGTPYELDGQGQILFLEEIGEEAYAIDRMLCQFEQSGLIDRIAGLAFGEFTRCHPVKPAAGEWTVREVIEQYVRRWGKPAIWGLPYGHGRHNGWLPLGRPAHLIAGKEKARLVLG